MRRLLGVALAALVLAACAARRPAPVFDREMPPEAPPGVQAPGAQPAAPGAPGKAAVPTHTVQRGETLVSIALQYGLDYRELAAWNGIVNPARIAVGQVLVLAPPPGAAQPPLAAAPVATPLLGAGPPIQARPIGNTDTMKVEPVAKKVPFSEKALEEMSAPEAAPATPGEPATGPVAGPRAPPAPPAPPPRAGTDKETVDWMWPAKGPVLAPFTEATKGMDIGGRKGSPVVAAADGRVIYADAGLRGYGKLVIIRHNRTWLSAYAHNDRILVKEQQEVRKGEKIAEMGSTDTDRVKLHFEVRREGKPVDPARVLPPR